MLALTRFSGFRVVLLALVAQQASLAVASPFDINGALVSRANYPNDACGQDSDCSSGDCVFFGYGAGTAACQRLFADGSYRDCSGINYGDGYCSGNALGKPCLDQSQCDKGRCVVASGQTTGKCSKTKVGDACKTSHGCSGLQLCTGGKCTLPTNGTLPAGVPCLANAQCKNNQCNTDVLPHDSNGLAYLEGSFLPENVLLCSFIPYGQSGCKTYADCDSGQCVKGTCTAAPDGYKCVNNKQCINVCSTQGRCYTPQSPLKRNKPCKQDSQCLSKDCRYRYVTLNRPSILTSNSSVPWYRDQTC